MRMKKLAAGMMTAALLLSLSSCGSSTIALGTGGTGGNYYACGNVIAQLAEENTDLKLEVKTTAGSAANLRLMQKDFVRLAIVQSDTLLDAVQGEGAFADNAVTSVSAVAGLYTEACQVVTASDAGITGISDLKGMRVSVGEEDSGVVRNAEQILSVYGMTMDDLEVSYLSFADSAEAMENGELDAFFCTAGAPTTAVSELSGTMDISVLSLDDRAVEQLTGLYSCYTPCTIPAGTYAGQDEDVTTVGVTAVLVASSKLSDDEVETITALLFDSAADLKYATGIDLSAGAGQAVEGIPVSFHPGAAAYYEKQGVSVAVSTGGKVTTVVASQDEN